MARRAVREETFDTEPLHFLREQRNEQPPLPTKTKKNHTSSTLNWTRKSVKSRYSHFSSMKRKEKVYQRGGGGAVLSRILTLLL